MSVIIFRFFVFAFAGWLVESTYRSFFAKRFINPGFNRGPWVPLYAFGALLIMGISSLTDGLSFPAKTAVYFSVITFMELLTGEILLRVYRQRFWDYRDNFLNFRGHICPLYSCAWTVMALLFEFLIYPFYLAIESHIPASAIPAVNVLILAAFALDFALSSGIIGLAGRYLRSDRIETRLSDALADLKSLVLKNEPLGLAAERIRSAGTRLVEAGAERSRWAREELKNLIQAARR